MPVNYHLKKIPKWYKDHKKVTSSKRPSKTICKIGATNKKMLDLLIKTIQTNK
jgi:hypothetical protein